MSNFKKRYVGNMMCLSVSVFFLFGLVFISYTNAGMLVYPAKGQTPEQQNKDEYECYQWAVQQTGYDPAKAQQAQIDHFNKAKGVCIEGRGYTVK